MEEDGLLKDLEKLVQANPVVIRSMLDKASHGGPSKVVEQSTVNPDIQAIRRTDRRWQGKQRWSF